MTVNPEAQRLADLFRRQAGSVIQRDSPLYSALLLRVADDVLGGGPTLELLCHRASERAGQALPLRLLASAHWLALAGSAPTLASHLPSTGGDGSEEGAWRAVTELIGTRASELDELLERPLQTNEPGRSQALISGLAAVAAATARPLRTLELGASAGLNLCWPDYRFDSDAGVLGDPHSQLRLTCAPWPRPLPKIQVAETRGCDAHPLDPEDPEDQLTLRSAVWADQPERLARLDAALAIAAQHPPLVERADALEWLEQIEPSPGTATVVFHSVVEQYLSHEQRGKLNTSMRQLINSATANAPVGWLSLERPQDQGAYGRAELRLALSPDPERHLLGHTSFHGSPVELDRRESRRWCEPSRLARRASVHRLRAASSR